MGSALKARDRVQVRHTRLLRVRQRRAGQENTPTEINRQKLTDSYSYR